MVSSCWHYPCVCLRHVDFGFQWLCVYGCVCVCVCVCPWVVNDHHSAVFGEAPVAVCVCLTGIVCVFVIAECSSSSESCPWKHAPRRGDAGRPRSSGLLSGTHTCRCCIANIWSLKKKWKIQLDCLLHSVYYCLLFTMDGQVDYTELWEYASIKFLRLYTQLLTDNVCVRVSEWHNNISLKIFK